MNPLQTSRGGVGRLSLDRRVCARPPESMDAGSDEGNDSQRSAEEHLSQQPPGCWIDIGQMMHDGPHGVIAEMSVGQAYRQVRLLERARKSGSPARHLRDGGVE